MRIGVYRKRRQEWRDKRWTSRGNHSKRTACKGQQRDSPLDVARQWKQDETGFSFLIPSGRLPLAQGAWLFESQWSEAWCWRLRQRWPNGARTNCRVSVVTELPDITWPINIRVKQWVWTRNSLRSTFKSLSLHLEFTEWLQITYSIRKL